MNRRSVVGPVAAALVFLSLGGYCGPPRWVDPSGHVASPSVLKEERGPEHCGWESATFLRYQRDWYVKDPQRALPPAEQPVGYTANAELPTDAVPTGFNSDGRELWISASTGGTAVFVVAPRGTERWPRLTAACL